MSEEETDNVIEVDFGGPRAAADAPARTSDPSAADKLEAFESLIDVGTVMVTLDARIDSVVVPEEFAGNPQLNLNFCHLFRVPDFAYDSEGVRASLSFSGRDIWCDVPWDAVYMLRSHGSGDVMIFPGSLPAEIRDLMPAMEDLVEEGPLRFHPDEPIDGEEE